MNGTATSKIQDFPAPYCYYAYAGLKDGGVDYMHYGYWTSDTRTIVEAQENLADLMKSYIPVGIQTILDSGCGLGRTTWDLKTKGFNVTGISPDRELILEAQRRYPELAQQFVCTRLEDFNATSQFDLVFFQESSQYIDVKVLFERLGKLVKADGFVLICDEVRYSNKPRLFNKKLDMLEFATINGFTLKRQEVITDKVLPTRTFFPKYLRDNLSDIVHQFSVTKRDVRHEVLELAAGWDESTEFFNSGDCGYEIFLFQKTKPASTGLNSWLTGAKYIARRKLRNGWSRLHSRWQAMLADIPQMNSKTGAKSYYSVGFS